MKGIAVALGTALAAAILLLGAVGAVASVTSSATKINSFSPSAAVTGTTIDVYGGDFTGAKWFEIGLLHVPFHVYAAGYATITVPANAASGPIGYADAAGNGTQSSAWFRVIPHITSFSPAKGTRESLITVKGTGLGGSDEHPDVTIGGASGSVQSHTPNTLKVWPSTTGGDITVSLSGFTSNAVSSFTLQPSFAKNGTFDPAAAPRGGHVFLFGGGFQGASSLKFGSVQASSYSVGPTGTWIDAIVPAGALTGTVVVTTPTGTATTSSSFHVLPTIAEPGSGPFAEGVAGSALAITGAALTGATSVKVGGVAAKFKVNSDTSISATVPAAAVTGPVSVTTAGGAGSTVLDYVVDPKISSFSPTTAKAGTTVTLNGSGFGASSEARDVEVGGVSATSVTWKSPNQVLFAVPVGARTGPVSIAVGGGTTAQSATSLTIPPNVVGYDLPTYEIGDAVIIEGNHLEGASAVAFGTVQAPSFTVAIDGDSIATHVPPGALTGGVSVTTPSGTVSGPTIHIVPTIDALPSTEGSTGSALAVTGDTFTATTHVTIGGVTASFHVASRTALSVTVPAAAVSGHLAVTNAGGTTTSTDAYVVDPHIASFSPTTAGAGATVTLTGSGFGASGETRDIEVGGVPASSSTWISPTSVKLVVAPATHTGTITINVSGGPVTAQSGGTLTVPAGVAGYDQPTYKAGDAVTIEGSNLQGATQLKFGSIVVSSGFSVAGDGNSIAATVPTNAVTGSVTVVTPTGSPVGPVLHVVPTIDSVSPADALAGATITLTGNTFTGTSAVHFGSATATFHVVSPTSLTTVVPAGAATGHVSVTNAGGTTASTQTFAPHPHITGFSATSGATGDTITINGSGLDDLTSVQFNGVSAQLPATVVSASPTALQVVVPDSAISGAVAVASPVGTATSPSSFTVTFSLTGITYSDAPSGAEVDLTGIGLTGATGLSLGGNYVGGGVATVLSDTSIVFTVPGAPPWEDLNGAVTVGKGSKVVRLAQPFSWLRITSTSPAAPAVGTTLTLHGSGFLQAHDVAFDLQNSTRDHVTTFDVNSDGTAISVPVPDGFGGGNVGVYLNNGLSFTTYLDAEYIWSLSPASGVAGDSVTINGSGFYGITHVSFNGTPATFSVGSFQQITATVPAGATTGPVTVTGDGGTTSSPSDFTVTG